MELKELLKLALLLVCVCVWVSQDWVLSVTMDWYQSVDICVFSYVWGCVSVCFGQVVIVFRYVFFVKYHFASKCDIYPLAFCCNVLNHLLTIYMNHIWVFRMFFLLALTLIFISICPSFLFVFYHPAIPPFWSCYHSFPSIFPQLL